MAVLKYGNDIIKHLSINNFSTRSPLNNSIVRVKIDLPRTKSNEILIQRPYRSFVIEHNNKSFYYFIFGNPALSKDTITIELNSELYNKLDDDIDFNIVINNDNPILAIQLILDNFSIPYDTYSLYSAFEWCKLHEIKQDIGYAKEVMTGKAEVFIDEILNRIGMKLVFDLEKNRVIICNLLDDYYQSGYTFDTNLIDPVTSKEKETTTFFNDFNIGVYPILSARSVHEYEYEVSFINGTDYFHQTLLKCEDPTYPATLPVILNRDWLVNDVYFYNGSKGILTGNKRLFSSGLEDVTLQRIATSKGLYDNIINSWKDTVMNNESGIIRFTGFAGAYYIGNKIIQKQYKKRNEKEFNYPYETFNDVGDIVSLSNDNRSFRITSKIYDSNLLTANYILEEVL